MFKQQLGRVGVISCQVYLGLGQGMEVLLAFAIQAYMGDSCAHRFFDKYE